MYDLVIEEKGGGEVLLIVNECVKNGVFVLEKERNEDEGGVFVRGREVFNG